MTKGYSLTLESPRGIIEEDPTQENGHALWELTLVPLVNEGFNCSDMGSGSGKHNFNHTVCNGLLWRTEVHHKQSSVCEIEFGLARDEMQGKL